MSNDDNSFVLASVSETERENACKKLRTITPFLDGELTLQAISQDSKVPLRTLSRWITRYRKSGFAGLVRQTRASSLSMPEEMLQLVEGLALQSSGRTVSSIKREIDIFATCLASSLFAGSDSLNLPVEYRVISVHSVLGPAGIALN